MKKTAIFSLSAVVLLAILVLPLIIALTTARAGMYQAQANAAQAAANATQATTGLISQCVTGLMVIVALVAGAAIGYGFHARRSLRSWQHDTQRKWAAGPRVWTQMHRANPPRLLPPVSSHTGMGGTRFSTIPPSLAHSLTMADLDAVGEEEADFIGSHWGF